MTDLLLISEERTLLRIYYSKVNTRNIEIAAIKTRLSSFIQNGLGHTNQQIVVLFAGFWGINQQQ
jgi:hypothetical protein